MSEYERLESEFRGRVNAEIKNIKKTVNDAVKGFNDTVIKSTEFIARTTERLKTGNKKFEEIDEKIEKVEKECSTIPNRKTVYGLIIIGFAILSFLVAFKGCTKGIKYYDSTSDKCDSTKYKCIDVRDIK